MADTLETLIETASEYGVTSIHTFRPPGETTWQANVTKLGVNSSGSKTLEQTAIKKGNTAEEALIRALREMTKTINQVNKKKAIAALFDDIL